MSRDFAVQPMPILSIDKLTMRFGGLAAVSAVDSRPLRPVKALALPELTTTARAFPPGRFARQKSTGAEGHFERVKTPAADAGASKTIIRTSVRPLYLMPAAAVAIRTPRTGGISAKVFGASGETEPDMAFPRKG